MVASISFPLEARGDEEEDDVEEADGEFASVLAAVGLPSREGGGSLAISITTGDRVRGESERSGSETESVERDKKKN